MAELVLHFDPDSGIDLDAAAKALQAHCAGVDQVEAASAEVDKSRTSLPDVLLILTTATTILSNSATALEALQKIVHALKDLAEDLGLRNLRVEAGMSQTPVAQLTEAQAKAALAPAP